MKGSDLVKDLGPRLDMIEERLGGIERALLSLAMFLPECPGHREVAAMAQRWEWDPASATYKASFTSRTQL